MFRPRDVSRYSVAVGLFHVHQHLLDRSVSVNRPLQDTDLDVVFIAGVMTTDCIPCGMYTGMYPMCQPKKTGLHCFSVRLVLQVSGPVVLFFLNYFLINYFKNF